MKFSTLTAATLALALATEAFKFPVADNVQNVLKDHGKKKPKVGKLHSSFVDFFSAQRSGTDTYLQDQVEQLYPGQTVTVTQDRMFDVLSWASGAKDPVLIREMEDLPMIKRTFFLQPRRRRDGEGVAAEGVVFGGWKVAWREHEFDVIMATWPEGFDQLTQWHIVSKDGGPAHDLVREVMRYTRSIKDVIWVFEMGGWAPDRGLWEAVQKASWDDVVLDADFKKSLQSDYRRFFKSEDLYRRLNVPWKRGLIFLGPPGNGKTISLKAIMHEMNSVPTLYVKTFSSFMGDEFSIREIFARARQEAPCILVLEDLDSIITDINRSFFLNEVDGLGDNDGILMIGTTNHFDRLDPGLSSRPSRFDRKYTFPDPTKEQRADYARYWQDKLSDNHDISFPDSLVDEFADKTDKFSFAFMKEAFVSSLLTLAAGEEKDAFATLLLRQVEYLRKELETDPDSASQHSGRSGGVAQAPGAGAGIPRPRNPFPVNGTVYRLPYTLGFGLEQEY